MTDAKKTKVLWTQDQQQRAQAEGWELIDTIENGRQKPVLRIYAYRFEPVRTSGLKAVPSNGDVQRHVLDHARSGSQLHLAALRAINRSAVAA